MFHFRRNRLQQSDLIGADIGKFAKPFNRLRVRQILHGNTVSRRNIRQLPTQKLFVFLYALLNGIQPLLNSLLLPHPFLNFFSILETLSFLYDTFTLRPLSIFDQFAYAFSIPNILPSGLPSFSSDSPQKCFRL